MSTNILLIIMIGENKNKKSKRGKYKNDMYIFFFPILYSQNIDNKNNNHLY